MAPGVSRSGGPVAAAAEFKQAPSEIQVAGLLFQFLPEVRRSLVAVRQRRRGAGMEVVPVTGERKHSEDYHHELSGCSKLTELGSRDRLVLPRWSKAENMAVKTPLNSFSLCTPTKLKSIGASLRCFLLVISKKTRILKTDKKLLYQRRPSLTVRSSVDGTVKLKSL